MTLLKVLINPSLLKDGPKLCQVQRLQFSIQYLLPAPASLGRANGLLMEIHDIQ
jgi:hypothetical protein